MHCSGVRVVGRACTAEEPLRLSCFDPTVEKDSVQRGQLVYFIFINIVSTGSKPTRLP